MAMNGYEACCMNCRFWKRLEAGKSAGHCRRSPPVILSMLRPHPSALNQMVQVADTFFPMTADTGWCGDYQKEVSFQRASAPIDLSKLALEDEELDPA